MSATDVDSVCTDADLEIHTGGHEGLQALLPEDWHDTGAAEKWAKPARQLALDITLRSLKSRRPPVFEADLLDVTELRLPVMFGALEIIFGAAIQHEDSPNEAKSKMFGKRFQAELAGLQPSVQAGSTASSMSVRLSRG